MKSFNDYLKANVGSMKVELKENEIKKFLFEDDDFGGDDSSGGDPFADIGDDDMSDSDGDMGDTNDDIGGDVGGADDGGTNGETGDDASELNVDDHDDDPDFTDGVSNPDDPALTETPAGKCIYDVDSAMRALSTVIETSEVEQLEEIEKVKKAVELIFNGKKLKPEDVQFSNTENAVWLINKIKEKIEDTITANYLSLKIKQPNMISKQDSKENLAKLKAEIKHSSELNQKV